MYELIIRLIERCERMNKFIGRGRCNNISQFSNLWPSKINFNKYMRETIFKVE